MPPNGYPRQPFNGCPKEDTISHIADAAHSFIRCTVTPLSSLILSKCQLQAAACHRRELSVLVDDSHNRIRELGTEQAIDHHCTHSYLSFTALLRLTT